ncbi:NACHT domain-containing NTPase [uncultured Lamprocystis sp.]|jgi:hypothetical protein|uniref:NACHT domain-containing protein n=1 Tax=uncultured Lamprocystis sp. TaxID=543132 RepID=UPI0025EC9461|nr:NACHT domain-containing protein [uncultured Lamprocystis sp.]
MDIATLAAELVRVLAPVLRELNHDADRGSQPPGQHRPDQSGRRQADLIWERLGPVLGQDSAAAQEVAARPDDPDAQAALRVELKHLLKGDPSLAQGLAALVDDTRSAVGTLIGLQGNGNVLAQGHGATTATGGSIVVRGNLTQNTFRLLDATPLPLSAADRQLALERYLQHVISRNRYLELQGIRSDGVAVPIELDRIYIRLHGTQQSLVGHPGADDWLGQEARLAPGERARLPQVSTETVVLSIEEALDAHPRLVVLGDPGSGKTTLLRYLSLPYARDLAAGSGAVQKMLGEGEPHRLPILLPLRQAATFLKAAPDNGTEGPALLIRFLLQSLVNERLDLPTDFFDNWLADGKVVLLLDGLDEVADPDLRVRLARLVDRFAVAYPDCRYVVTSRIFGYLTGVARLSDAFDLTTILEFSLDDVLCFLTNWHRAVAVAAHVAPGATADAYAADQTRRLMNAIEGNERIRDLAINPLILTVIAMIHRDRTRLPDRRADLYQEAVAVLLRNWDQANGIQAPRVLGDHPFDTGDMRGILQALALHMHEQAIKQIDAADLRRRLLVLFGELLSNAREAAHAVDRFVEVVRARTGLLVERGEGIYAFSHLTFQEYLAALAVAARDDYLSYSLRRVGDPWWREVILLEAGSLGTQGQERAPCLVRGIASRPSPRDDPYRNLILAAECLRDLGPCADQDVLEQEVLGRLRKELDDSPRARSRWAKDLDLKGWIDRRSRAMEALIRAGAVGGFWRPPFGEPEWVRIPAGSFWMGSERGSGRERPMHQLELPEY